MTCTCLLEGLHLQRPFFVFFSLSNLQSGAAVQSQKKTQDTANRAEAAGTDCIICSENVATVTFKPCGHKVTCSGKTIQNRKKQAFGTADGSRGLVYRRGTSLVSWAGSVVPFFFLKLSLCLYEKAGSRRDLGYSSRILGSGPAHLLI